MMVICHFSNQLRQLRMVRHAAVSALFVFCHGHSAAQTSRNMEAAPVGASVSYSSTDVAESLKSAAEKITKVNERLEQLERLLAMNDNERGKALEARPETKEYLKSELEKYNRMNPAERREALHSLRTWYYLRVLVRLPGNVRDQALALISPEDREMVVKRLRRWDRLDAGLQREVLEHERFIRYVLQFDGLPRQEQESRADGLPDGLKKNWNDRLSQWHDLPDDRRREIYNHFKRFFDLSVSEREKVLQTMTQQEREKAKPSLDAIAALEKLTPEERAACLESFKSFAEAAPKSTNLYLHLDTFQRWNNLSAKEKDMLRSISRALATLPPPSLPGEEAKPPVPVNREPPALPGSSPK